MAKKTKNLKFEEALLRLEAIIAEMENSDTSLEDSMNLYKEGVALSIFLTGSLKTVEEEVKALKETAAGAFREVSFDSGEN